MKIIWIGEDLKTHKIDLSNAISIEIDGMSLREIGVKGQFSAAKIGDFLRCDKVFSQSKKYKVGGTYEIIKERYDKWLGFQIAIRDKNNKLTWINRKGISYTDFTVIHRV